MMRLLRRKHAAENSNGNAWAFLEQVRNQTGYSASTTRTIDAISMSLWPSRGLEMHAFEIKCSRSDWLSELKKPEKADAFVKFVDRFWIVAADRDIVTAGELPPTWGLLYPHGSGLGVGTVAPKLEPEHPDRRFLAALLRQAAVEAARPPEEIAAARSDGYSAGYEEAEHSHARQVERLEQRITVLQERDEELLQAIGFDNATLTAQLRSSSRLRREEFAKAVKTALDGNAQVESLRAQIKRMSHDAKTLAERAEKLIEDYT